jgi:hypothetical protein
MDLGDHQPRRGECGGEERAGDPEAHPAVARRRALDHGDVDGESTADPEQARQVAKARRKEPDAARLHRVFGPAARLAR